MRYVELDSGWPESWQMSYSFDLQEVYGQITRYGYAYAYRNRAERTLKLIQDAVSPGAHILDVAAAQGNFSLRLAEAGYKVTWNDLRHELADYVKLKYEKGHIDYCAGNVFELGFAEKFDCVLISEVIEHVAHPDKFLRKIATMVKPGGHIVMTTPNGAHFRNRLPRFSDCPDPSVYEEMQFKPDSDGHIFLLWPPEIISLAANAGLEIEEQSYYTTSLTNGHLKTETLLKFLPASLVFALERIAGKFPIKFKYRLMLNTGVRFRRCTK